MSDADFVVRFLPQTRAKVEAVGERRLSGYPIVFNSLSQDLGGFREQIKPEAVDRTLTSGDNVDALIDHRRETTAILGSTDSGLLRLEKDKTGVRAVIRPPDTATARDVLEVVRSGLVGGMSFAFRTMPDGDSWDLDPTTGGLLRTVTDMVWREVSIVLDPAYLDTEINVRTAAVDRRSLAAAQSLVRRFPEVQYREDLLVTKGLLQRSTPPRGRPRQFDGPPVSIRLPASLHDALAREAIDRSVDMAAVIRERLQRR